MIWFFDSDDGVHRGLPDRRCRCDRRYQLGRKDHQVGHGLVAETVHGADLQLGLGQFDLIFPVFRPELNTLFACARRRYIVILTRTTLTFV
jgi:hypothetical protein